LGPHLLVVSHLVPMSAAAVLLGVLAGCGGGSTTLGDQDAQAYGNAGGRPGDPPRVDGATTAPPSGDGGPLSDASVPPDGSPDAPTPKPDARACLLGCDQPDACQVGPGRCNEQTGVCEYALKPRGDVCRPLAGACDVREICDGATPDCPPDLLLPKNIVCRPASLPCDVAESCDGSSPQCPADGVRSADHVCRQSFGACDKVDACTGFTKECPDDEFLARGTVCRRGPAVPAGEISCAVDAVCPGNSVVCPAISYQPAGTVCRPSTGPCDAAELCLGTDPSCPSDRICRPRPDQVCSTEPGVCAAKPCSDVAGGSDCGGGACDVSSCAGPTFACRQVGIKRLGEFCSGSGFDLLTCGIGLACAGTAGGFTCHKLCRTNADCPAGSTCTNRYECSDPQTPPYLCYP
jgi:hypothetical protein